MRHVYYYPDCPECGAEMLKHASYDGEWTEWWECPWCSYQSEHVARKDFVALTEQLTADLRKEDGR